MTPSSETPAIQVAIDLTDMAGDVIGLWTHDVTLEDGTFFELGIRDSEHGFRWIVSGDTQVGVGATDGKGYGSYEEALDAAMSYLRGL